MRRSGQRVAIVTGGSRGIGAATAKRLAGDGFAVALTYNARADAADEVVEAITKVGGEALAVQADLGARDDIARLFTATEERFGARLDALVLNAAAIPYGLTTELSEHDWDWAFAVNVKAAFLACREAMRRMGDGGRIVAVSSGLADTPMANTSAYSASKSAVETLVRSLAKEVGPRGVTVNAVRPGITKTESLTIPQPHIDALVAQTPLRRVGEPEDLADVIAFLVSNDARWVTGQVIYASGGLWGTGT
jgi:3-oxoacyl-[acyl-carrier protein] reductase